MRGLAIGIVITAAPLLAGGRTATSRPETASASTTSRPARDLRSVFQPAGPCRPKSGRRRSTSSPRKFRVVAIDPRSQGKSDRTAEGPLPDAPRGGHQRRSSNQLKLAPADAGRWSLAWSRCSPMVERFGTSTLRGIVLVDGFVGMEPDLERRSRRSPDAEIGPDESPPSGTRSSFGPCTRSRSRRRTWTRSPPRRCRSRRTRRLVLLANPAMNGWTCAPCWRRSTSRFCTR